MGSFQNSLPVDVSGSTVYSVGSATIGGGSVATYQMGGLVAGMTTIPVGTSAVQILDSNVTRSFATIQNKTGGSATVYLGVDNTVTSGMTGLNYASLDVGSNSTGDYAGDLYAIHGSSGYFSYIGVFEVTV